MYDLGCVCKYWAIPGVEVYFLLGVRVTLSMEECVELITLCFQGPWLFKLLSYCIVPLLSSTDFYYFIKFIFPIHQVVFPLSPYPPKSLIIDHFFASLSPSTPFGSLIIATRPSQVSDRPLQSHPPPSFCLPSLPLSLHITTRNKKSSKLTMNMHLLPTTPLFERNTQTSHLLKVPLFIYKYTHR